MQDITRDGQHHDETAPVGPETGEQPELLAIRLLDKIETIQNKANSR